MRASRQAGSARKAASTSAMAGASEIAGSSRSFCCAARKAMSVGRAAGNFTVRRCSRPQTQRGEHAPGRHRDPRIDQHGRERWQVERRGEYLADPAHDARARVDADRHVGAGRARRRIEARIAIEPVDAREQAQRRRCIGGAAAEPGGNRQPLVEREAAQAEAVDLGRERAGGLEHEIVVDGTRRGRARPAHGEPERSAGNDPQAVPHARKDHQALNGVIAIGAAADDAQGQVDLGGRMFDEHACSRCPPCAWGIGHGELRQSARRALSRRRRASWSCPRLRRARVLRAFRDAAFPRSSRALQARA